MLDKGEKTQGTTQTGKEEKTNDDKYNPKGNDNGNKPNKKRNDGLYYLFLIVVISLALVTFVNILITYNFFSKYSLKDFKSLSLKDLF